MAGLADALSELLALSPAERASLGALARKRVETLFEIQAVVRRYEDFYESLLVA
jgi:glycosyltransferase involved in cell wall biosynthesis